MVSGVVRGLRADFWWDYASGSRHHAWAVDPSDSKKLECAIVLCCRKVAENLLKDDAIDDCEEIPATRAGTAPPGRLRASTSGWDSAVVRELSFDFGGAAPQDFVAVDGLSIQVMTSNLSAMNCSG